MYEVDHGLMVAIKHRVLRHSAEPAIFFCLGDHILYRNRFQKTSNCWYSDGY